MQAVMTMNIKMYSELITLPTFEERFCYLKLDGAVGAPGYEIFGPILIHHLNPITYEDLLNQSPCVFDPENVICTKLNTHNAIHYGDESLLLLPPVQRTQNDTCPWRK